MLEQRTEQQERETSTLKVNVSELKLQLQACLASTQNGSFLWCMVISHYCHRPLLS